MILCLTLQVPWTEIGKKPTIIEIDELYLLVGSNSTTVCNQRTKIYDCE
jgi:hypothetical protein